MRISAVGSLPFESDDFVGSHPLGTVFHTSAWQRLIASSLPHKPRHLAACEDSRIVGILPLFLVKSLVFGRMLISTPQAAYGGILAASDHAASGLLEAAREMARKENVQFLELRSFQNPVVAPLPRKDMYVTIRRELSGNPEDIMASIPRKTRAEIREGIRNGLEFRVDSIRVDDFFGIYAQNVRDLGTPVFSMRLFSNGKREFGENCKIFSVHFHAKPVAAVWTLTYKDEVVPYYGASLREYNHLAVNNFMYWMLIRWGCENGYRVFDFGRSKKGSGSFDFKKRWGMEIFDLPYQYYLVCKKNMPDTSPMNRKFSLGIRLWQKLPLPVANTLGPLISRHLI